MKPRIDKIHPPAAITGGEIELRGADFCENGEKRPTVSIGSAAARLVVGGSNFIVARVPGDAGGSSVTVANEADRSEAHACSIGLRIASNMHPVANPAVDAAGNVYTTFSGSRGQKVPVSIFKIDLNFQVKPFVSEIVNPTGLIFNQAGNLLVSSRNTGTIYSVDPAGRIEIYAEGMGVATGMALDAEENLYVGDRTGTIFKISPSRQIYVFATLEQSVSAYHLAISPDGVLHASGPTTSSYDAVYRITDRGDVEVHFRGLGRPQGLVFDPKGRLCVAASYGGRKGVFRLEPGKRPQQIVSGPGIVGLAFLPTRELVVATTSELYRVPTAGWIGR